MGLSASMWTSVSGLLAHGNKMNVVGNNIANVSTIGFKSQRMDFNDYLYISGGSTSGPVQIGAGVATYAVIGDFSQGSLESTNSVTDIAIDGEGFFKVRRPNTDQSYYTRAGDFYFNAERQLQNPEGYFLQGWKIDNSTRLTFKNDSVNLGGSTTNESAFQGTGTPVDIVLDSWYLEPQRTSSVNFTMGLTSDGKEDNSTSTTNPLTALFDQWDATKNPPMADSSFATSSSIKVYDEGGTAHTLTVYYDQVASKATDADGNVIYEIAGLPAGYTVYEYCVTIPPEQDMRSYGGTGFDEATNEFSGSEPISFYNDPVHGTNKNAGMLMTGHLIFDAAGNLVNQSAYSYGANSDTPKGDQCQLEPNQLSSWQATKFSSNGLPVFCANFTGQPLANSVSELKKDGQSQAQDFLIELDLGLRTRGDWTYAGSLDDLAGQIRPPVVNTPTRVSMASQSYQQKVEYTKPATPPVADEGYWKVNEPANGTLPELNGDKLKWNDPNGVIKVQMYDSDPANRVQIQCDKQGPIQVIVNGTSGKQISPAEWKALSTTEQKEYVLAYVGKDGKPIPDKDNGGWFPNAAVSLDGNDEIVRSFVDAKGNDASFYWERSLKKIPNSVLTTEYERLPSKAEATAASKDPKDPVDTIPTSGDAKTIYALNKAGQKLAVNFTDEGVILGVAKLNDQGKPVDSNGAVLTPGVKAGWDDYNGEALYIDKAISTQVVDYNNAFSTFDDPVRAENASKAAGSSFVTQDAGQNGYPSGVLSGTNITADGVVYGYYDNGETVPLYQIALYDFHNKQGLRREGGNLYAQTKESGEARQGVAGENGFGQTKAYNIESSNVDMSREFVNMISTQRGFQANSKGITTVDTMLETVIGMKR